MFAHPFRTLKCAAATITILIMTMGTAAAEEWQPLALRVTGIQPERGGMIQVFVFLQDGFPLRHAKALKSYVHPASGSEIQISIEVPADSSFALKVHHDEDGNNKVTKNWTRMFPKEGLGFSAGARVRMRPPRFSEAEMRLPKSGRVTIPILYP